MISRIALALAELGSAEYCGLATSGAAPGAGGCDRGAVLRAIPCKMAVAAGCILIRQPGGRAGRAGRRTRHGRLARAAPHGSAVIQEGLVRAKKHGTKSGSGALLRRGFSFCFIRLSGCRAPRYIKILTSMINNSNNIVGEYNIYVTIYSALPIL